MSAVVYSPRRKAVTSYEERRPARSEIIRRISGAESERS
jgi:hypothetical protein